MNAGELGVLIPIIGMMIGAFALFARSEIGRAFAQRLRGEASAGVQPALHAELDRLHGEVESLRADLVETQERLDFTERLLAGSRNEP